MKIKRLEQPAFNYKAAIEEDLNRLRSYVKLNCFWQSTALKIETDQFGYIVLLQNGEVMGLISNKNIALIDKQEKDYTADANDITEALLYKLISETLPANLVWDYLPTLLIFLELLGLSYDRMDFSLWDDKYINNQFCLCTGLRITEKGNLFAYDDDTDYKEVGSNKGKSYYRKFTQATPESTGPKVEQKSPGVFLYHEIVRHFKAHLKRLSDMEDDRNESFGPDPDFRNSIEKIYKAFRNYIELSLKLLKTNNSFIQGYTPTELRKEDGDLIENNIDELMKDDILMVFKNGEPDLIIDYYLLFEKINSKRTTKKKLAVENFLININLIKKILQDS